METIRQLREETQYIPPVTRRSTGASDTRTIDSQVTLCHLAQNMVETERVPTAPPETFTFTKLKRKRRSQRSTNDSSRSPPPRRQRQNVNSPGTPPTPPRTLRSLPGPLEARQTETEDDASQEKSQPVSPDEPPKAIPQEPITPTSISEPASTSALAPASTSGLASSSKSAAKLGSELHANVEPTESPVSEPRRERVKRTTSITQDGADLHNTVVAGWVPAASGDQMVEAYIDRRLKYNLISQDLRERLGLLMEQHTGETVGQYNGQAWRSLGTTTLRWGSNRIPCRCYVIDRLERPLIFGRMFPLPFEEL